jgi:acylphosphatase
VNLTTLAQVHIVVRGHVQGVYFRQSLKQEADLRGLHGWVRNLPDGSVEALVQGPPESVSALVTWARHGPSRARVESAEVSWSGVETPMSSFKVTD